MKANNYVSKDKFKTYKVMLGDTSVMLVPAINKECAWETVKQVISIKEVRKR